MRILTPLIAICLVLLCCCARDEMRFTRGTGDAGQFMLQQALARGARPVATNNLPVVGGHWRYSEDQYGMVLQLPSKQFSEVQSFLRQAFGPPAQEPTETTEGGKLGWYAGKTIGVGVQFGYDRKHTQVIILQLRHWKKTSD
jgi:hypothetical protein